MDWDLGSGPDFKFRFRSDFRLGSRPRFRYRFLDVDWDTDFNPVLNLDLVQFLDLDWYPDPDPEFKFRFNLDFRFELRPSFRSRF